MAAQDLDRTAPRPFPDITSSLSPEVGQLPAGMAPSMVERVALRIESDIADGALLPGTRLIETLIAERLGVSRIPVREALKSLEARGLVINRGRRGTYVARPLADELEQLVVMRATLEGLAGRILATEGSEDDFAGLDRLNEAMRATIGAGDPKACLDAHWAFHEAVCALSGNRFLVASWLSMRTLIRMAFQTQPIFGGDLVRETASHDRLMTLVRSRQAAAVEANLRNGILRSGFKALGRPVPAALAPLLTEEPVDG
ncbi:MAG TPA: GntR family transcriptional regulator [Azospirillaceae bacterium]|nr:GntR family transcriptional regulator [Azospirillaceae bacterium]